VATKSWLYFLTEFQEGVRPGRRDRARPLLRSAVGDDRVLSDADVDLLATIAWTSLGPAA
jgi:hypothetical protein